MNSLNHYTDAAITKALTDNGAFYAFSNEQFNEQKKPDVVYQRGPSGLIIPKDKVESLLTAMNAAVDQGISQRLLDHPVDDIIAYELANYECYYTGDISSTLDAIADYPGINKDLVIQTYKKEAPNADM